MSATETLFLIDEDGASWLIPDESEARRFAESERCGGLRVTLGLVKVPERDAADFRASPDKDDHPLLEAVIRGDHPIAWEVS